MTNLYVNDFCCFQPSLPWQPRPGPLLRNLNLPRCISSMGYWVLIAYFSVRKYANLRFFCVFCVFYRVKTHQNTQLRIWVRILRIFGQFLRICATKNTHAYFVRISLRINENSLRTGGSILRISWDICVFLTDL